MKNYKFDGKGKFTSYDGEIYNGDWKMGKKHGKGVWRLNN